MNDVPEEALGCQEPSTKWRSAFWEPAAGEACVWARRKRHRLLPGSRVRWEGRSRPGRQARP